jgi:hypothetical protein
MSEEFYRFPFEERKAIKTSAMFAISLKMYTKRG